MEGRSGVSAPGRRVMLTLTLETGPAPVFHVIMRDRPFPGPPAQNAAEVSNNFCSPSEMTFFSGHSM